MTKLNYCIVKYTNPKGEIRYAFNREYHENYIANYWRVNEEPKGYKLIGKLTCNNDDFIVAWLYNHKSFGIRKCKRNFEMMDKLTDGKFSKEF